MGYEIVRGPFMLLETVGMLYKFVNGVSFVSLMTRHKFLGSKAVTEAMTRRMECLQQIMEEVCDGLDPQDTQLQRFFGRAEVESEETCVARLMIGATFITLKTSGLRENAEEICDIWDSLRERGAWITPGSAASLAFSVGDGCPGDLFDQISELRYPAEFQIVLYKALRNFRKTMDELIRLIEPLSVRLEERLLQESWIMDETEQYWHKEFARMSPLEFLVSSSGDKKVIGGANEHTLVAISYMNSNQVVYGMADGISGKREHNAIVIGSMATSTVIARSKTGDMEMVGTVLKALGDKRRLDILRRLAKNRSYCHELAGLMGIDPGHMSRNLALLHSFGFLRQEREPLIYYYETDREAIHNFLQLVETTIFD